MATLTLIQLKDLARFYNVSPSGTKFTIASRLYSLRSVYIPMKMRKTLEAFIGVTTPDRRPTKRFPTQ